MRVTAYIGLGSNLAGVLAGEVAGSMASPTAHVKRALETLSRLHATQLCTHSSLYCSKPLPTKADIRQADYINAVAAIETELVAEELLDALQAIEAEHHRLREEKWGPRTLDLDLLLFGNRQMDTPRLQIPHPGLPERAFVLYPLAEIAPELEIPGFGPLTQLLAACPRNDLRMIEE